MGTTQPPVQYLVESSDNAVEAHFLSCQNQLANVERSLTDLLDRWLQTQNAERLGRTMLHLRRAGTDSQLPVRVVAASSRLLFSPASALLAVYRPSTPVQSLSSVTYPAGLYALLQGSAFTVAIGEFTAASTLPHTARLQESTSRAVSDASIDHSLRVPRKPPTRPSPMHPSPIEVRPVPIKVCRARPGCLPLWASRKLLRASDFPRCAKIA